MNVGINNLRGGSLLEKPGVSFPVVKTVLFYKLKTVGDKARFEGLLQVGSMKLKLPKAEIL